MASTDQAEPQAPLPKKPWTVMVYMAADDSAELDGHAVNDLREMERGVHDDVNVVVQIKRYWPDVPERYVISRTGDEVHVVPQRALGSSRASMGDGKTLERLLTWTVQHHPAEHYMLVLWGHAYGLGFGRDHGDPLQLTELTEALEAFRRARLGVRWKAAVGKDPRAGLLDILGANACAMSYVEGAYQLRKSAEYLVASQIYVPFAGWPFTAVLQSIGPRTKPRELGLAIVNAYLAELNNPLSGERVQMSLLNLRKAEALKSALRGLATAVRETFKASGRFDAETRARVRDAFIGSAAGDVRPLIDLTDLCRMLLRDLCGLSPEPRSKLKKVLDSVESLIAGRRQKPTKPPTEGFVVKQASHPTLQNLHGIGVYAPFVTDEQDLKRLGLEDDRDLSPKPRPRGRQEETNRLSYDQLEIFKDGSVAWPTLVYDDLREPISSELTALIESIGVTRASDRLEVTQIVLSIESAFNRVDHVLREAQRQVQEGLPRTPGTRSVGREKRDAGPALQLLAMVPLLDHAGKATPLHVTGGPALHWLCALEEAVGFAERAARAGLTQARFGIGPATATTGFAPDAPPKHGGGPPPLDGFAPPKHGEGPEDPGADGRRSFVRTLSPEILPVVDLFGQAARALHRLEAQTLELERAVAAASQRLGKRLRRELKDDLKVRQAFAILCEVATSARRVIRRVIANPAYGLGPAPGPFGIDEREELANVAGLGCGNLILLAADASMPDRKPKP